MLRNKKKMPKEELKIQTMKESKKRKEKYWKMIERKIEYKKSEWI